MSTGTDACRELAPSPATHITIGTFRRPWADFSRMAAGAYSVHCNCGTGCTTLASLHEHWMLGHFDDVVYREIGKAQTLAGRHIQELIDVLKNPRLGGQINTIAQDMERAARADQLDGGQPNLMGRCEYEVQETRAWCVVHSQHLGACLHALWNEVDAARACAQNVPKTDVNMGKTDLSGLLRSTMRGQTKSPETP